MDLLNALTSNHVERGKHSTVNIEVSRKEAQEAQEGDDGVNSTLDVEGIRW